MSLYDDLDTDKKSENVAGWASGIRLLQSQMQLKKAAVTQPKRDLTRKQVSSLGPVIDFNKVSKVPLGSKDPDDDGSSPMPTPAFSIPYSLTMPKHTTKKKGSANRIVSTYLSVDPEWQFDDEYDPLWPNDYDKALKDMRERREREAEQEEEKRKTQDDLSGDEGFPPTNSSSRSMSSGAGVAIAPPPSLSQSSDFDRSDSGGGNMGGGRFGLGGVGAGAAAAARIMAKYGYKEGQGLGKKEQGMSSALQVERITHRTGRIIHEKDLLKEVNAPNPFGLVSSMAAYNDINDEDDTEMFGPESEEGTVSNLAVGVATEVEVIQAEQSLAELLKNPSKVVLLKNMVGPGEVDDDLEPEVKDECQTKYGPVNNVTIYQMPDMDEDAIRIFVEFGHEDSAEKALLDLNNRFFGGRQVKASFYDYSKYTNLELTE